MLFWVELATGYAFKISKDRPSYTGYANVLPDEYYLLVSILTYNG